MYMGHGFEIYTLISEIHKNVDLVLGIQNLFELEGVINSRDCFLCIDLSFCHVIIRTLPFSLLQNISVIKRQAFMLY